MLLHLLRVLKLKVIIEILVNEPIKTSINQGDVFDAFAAVLNGKVLFSLKF